VKPTPGLVEWKEPPSHKSLKRNKHRKQNMRIKVDQNVQMGWPVHGGMLDSAMQVLQPDRSSNEEWNKKGKNARRENG
jgi:hypothetical protein